MRRLFKVLMAIIMVSSFAFSQESKINERDVIDLSLVEKIFRGDSIALEGEVVKNGDFYEIQTSFGENRSFILRFIDHEPKNFQAGRCRIVGKIKFEDKLKAINYIEVEKISPVEVTGPKLIEGLMHQVIDLNKMAFTAQGSQDLAKNIDRIKILLMAQDTFFDKYFPTAYSKVKKVVKTDFTKDPFE